MVWNVARVKNVCFGSSFVSRCHPPSHSSPLPQCGQFRGQQLANESTSDQGGEEPWRVTPLKRRGVGGAVGSRARGNPVEPTLVRVAGARSTIPSARTSIGRPVDVVDWRRGSGNSEWKRPRTPRPTPYWSACGGFSMSCENLDSQPPKSPVSVQPPTHAPSRYTPSRPLRALHGWIASWSLKGREDRVHCEVINPPEKSGAGD